MSDFHGIVFAYNANPELRELVSHRTAASLPFCGRYRLIDFALSSLRNAGIVDVGLIMQRDYQSLLDHIGSGKSWDMSRRTGGLRMLPPFGLPEYHKGEYSGTIEALNAVRSYIEACSENHIVLLLGNICANIDISAACELHYHSDADITAICTHNEPEGYHHRYVISKDGYVEKVLFDRIGKGEGLPSLEGYIVNKDTLLRLMDKCKSEGLYRFHKDAIAIFLREGGLMNVYFHDEYSKIVKTVAGYFNANMDMLNREIREQVFPTSRPVRTKSPDGVSAYYGTNSSCVNSLVADNCIIEGHVENSILFSGVTVKENASLKNCIIMKDCIIGDSTELEHVIADKDVTFSNSITLIGNKGLPMVVPKGSQI